MSVLSKQYTSHPEDYLYMFASESFLAKMDAKSRKIITAKAYYQKKIIVNAVTNAHYDEARAELRQALIDLYGKTPAQILTDLAAGKTVAGKNWAEGVYGVQGVGAVVNTFASNVAVTVDPQTGMISQGGKVVSTDATAIVGNSKATGNVIGYYYRDENGNCYTSQYNKVTKRFSAGTVSDKDGNVRLADGSLTTNAAMNSIWTSIISGVEQFTNWILQRLEVKENEQLLTPQIALPDATDGFVQEEDENGWIKPVLIAGGVAVAAAAAVAVAPSIKKQLGK